MKLLILEINAEGTSDYHTDLFLKHNRINDIEYRYVTFKKAVYTDRHFLKFCPDTKWHETRNVLFNYALRRKEDFDYIMFIDDDVILEDSNGNRNCIEILMEELEKYKPAGLMPKYSPSNKNEMVPLPSKPKNTTVCKRLFTNNCIKIYHRSIIDWVMPYCSKFEGSWSACHMINFLEIPFKEHMLVTYSVRSSNIKHSGHEVGNNGSHIKNVNKLWEWIKPSFQKIEAKKDCVSTKKYYQTKYTLFNYVVPSEQLKDLNFIKYTNLSVYFNLSHEFFKKERIKFVS